MARMKRTGPSAEANTEGPPSKRVKTTPDTAASSRSRRGSGTDTLELVGFKGSKTVKSTEPPRQSSRANKETAKASEQSTPQPPKKRGRPPKLQPPVKAASPSAVIKKRGRPSKAEKQILEAATKDVAAAKDRSNQLTTEDTIKTAANVNTPKAENVQEETMVGDDIGIASDVEGEDDSSDEGHSYWLMKAEPESRMEKGVDVKFSIQDLEAVTEPEAWDGVRNPSARNNMRSMLSGDLAFFYHSNCKIPAIVGIMEIVKEHSPDKSALDPKHPYYDPKEKADAQKWCVVHVEHRLTLDTPVRLKDLQQYKNPGQPLADMQMLKQTRLSVSKVSRKEWNYILALAEVGGKWKATVKNEAKS